MKPIIRNFLNTLRRYKASSALNIAGLSVAFATLYIIFVQVNFDFTFNKSINDHDRVYRVEMMGGMGQAKYTSSLIRPIPEMCFKDFPLIENYGTGWLGPQKYPSNYCFEKDQSVKEANFISSRFSSGMYDVFGFEFLSGNISDIENPKHVIISQSASEKYNLNVGDAIYSGDIISPDNLLTIAAVFKDFPNNCDLSNLELISNIGNKFIDNWSEWNNTYYVKLTSANSVDDFYKHTNSVLRKLFSDRISDLFDGNKDFEGMSAEEKQATLESEEIQNEIDSQSKKYQMRLVPIGEIYFATDSSGTGYKGNKATSYTLLAVAILILIIALINFVNFFFALIPVRIKEVNIHKIFGNPTSALRANFIFEAFGLVLIALFIAWHIVYLVNISSVANYISAPIALAENAKIVFYTIFAGIIIALIGSVYPSYYITSFSPAFAVKGSFGATKQGQFLRTSLIGLQFVISISLIICVSFIKLQHNYMMNYDMGFNKEMLLTSSLPNSIIGNVSKRDAFSDKLKSNTMIVDVAYGDGDFVRPGRMGWGRNFKGNQISLQVYPVSWNFLGFMGIEIKDGRDFVPTDEEKENGTFIMNEQAMKEYGFTLEDRVAGHAEPTEIIGVCEDFNFKPLQYGIVPFCFYVFGNNPWRMPNKIYLRTSANADIKAVVNHLKVSVSEFASDYRVDKMEVDFFDAQLEAQYTTEQKLITLIRCLIPKKVYSI